MNVVTALGVAATSLPFALAIGGSVRWVYTQRANKRTSDTEHANAAYTRLQGEKDGLNQELADIAPRLSVIRAEYTEAVQQCMSLLDQLRDATEENARITSERVDERIALLRKINAQRDYIVDLRDRMRQAGVNPPPLPPFLTTEVQLKNLEEGDHGQQR